MAKEDKKNIGEEKPLINCLRNEQVIVRYLPKQSRMVTNPKHVLFGGMAENATRTFVVPMLSSGRYVNVLTDSEKNFLEELMGLPTNALSIYKKVDNFWDDANEAGISKVTLRKQDNYLNLANVEDYIAPSLEALETNPKAT